MPEEFEEWKVLVANGSIDLDTHAAIAEYLHKSRAQSPRNRFENFEKIMSRLNDNTLNFDLNKKNG